MLLSGCVSKETSYDTRPTQQELALASYPPRPDYKAAAQAYFARILKDPAGANYSDWKLCHAWASPPLQFGWVAVVSVNARNSYGGLAGGGLYFLWIGADGKAVNIVGAPFHVERLDVVESD